MRPRIYISTPLPSPTNELALLDTAVAVTRQLIDAGFAPLCPHLFHHLDPVDDIPRDVWTKIAIPWVMVSDAVAEIMKPGRLSEEQRAANAERLKEYQFPPARGAPDSGHSRDAAA